MLRYAAYYNDFEAFPEKILSGQTSDPRFMLCKYSRNDPSSIFFARGYIDFIDNHGSIAIHQPFPDQVPSVSHGLIVVEAETP